MNYWTFIKWMFVDNYGSFVDNDGSRLIEKNNDLSPPNTVLLIHKLMPVQTRTERHPYDSDGLVVSVVLVTTNKICMYYTRPNFLTTETSSSTTTTKLSDLFLQQSLVPAR